MGGRPNGRTKPPLDASGEAAESCREIADVFGWPAKTVRYWWWQIALAVEFHNDLPRPVVERLTTGMVQRVFDKRGQPGN